MSAAWIHQKNKVILSAFALYQWHMNNTWNFLSIFMDFYDESSLDSSKLRSAGR